MLEGLKDAIARILASKKAILASLAAAANFIAVSLGTDPTEAVMLVANGLFGVLLGAQILLDLRWGSTSDGTGPEEEMILPVAPLPELPE